jgi:hypothetical protein
MYKICGHCLPDFDQRQFVLFDVSEFVFRKFPRTILVNASSYGFTHIPDLCVRSEVKEAVNEVAAHVRQILHDIIKDGGQQMSFHTSNQKHNNFFNSFS